ncbi:hypothetical protein CO180_03335 [candidate division WWE3 bacterium CG_4_9_14_3_um_filter_41_6]|uniref:Uncharacterized protein n=1 Tax=candidate division WWE3 bacterium CG_4_10_14_0_2_um_filter_41_14 TaxID=1975072 RepID=A0A2M7TM27_UNCKA|nr:MAG: hypothetical protein COY32_00140 [candidate division WWE3 bacterium CG_4_10_14_0_2_um_filter_41_14]PJA38540.1 MAG: hypothetical protein CO180_03335 [candidate division WWE3 bacterium CG_4_9_14_3_um_filter_41_6]
MSLLPKTQDHLDIEDIKDDVLILTGGRFRLVVETTAVNFDLLSEDEQNASIFAYANLVNSLDYAIQILVRTRQVDITTYLHFLRGQLRDQPSAVMKEQLSDYIDFVEQLVLKNTVLQKRFYVSIPYSNTSAVQKNMLDDFAAMLPFSKSKPKSKTFSEDILAKARTSMFRRVDDLKWQFRRLGIQIRILTTEELIRLFYEIYNPEAGENNGITQDPFGYTTPIVHSTLSNEMSERKEEAKKEESKATTQNDTSEQQENKSNKESRSVKQQDEMVHTSPDTGKNG